MKCTNGNKTIEKVGARKGTLGSKSMELYVWRNSINYKYKISIFV